jgi:hypothetical protein
VEGVLIAVGVEVDGGEEVGEEGFEFYFLAEDFDAFDVVDEVFVPKDGELYGFLGEDSNWSTLSRAGGGGTLGD